MRKMMSLMIALVTLFTAMMSFALASGSDWYCSTCGAERTTEWCPICGSHRPASSSDTWTCPQCGKELPAEYRYCPDDRTQWTESNGNWPIRQLTGVSTDFQKLGSLEDRHQSFLGPNANNYSGAGAYKTYEVTKATALFREGGYVLVDLTYRTVGRRCVYFQASSLKRTNVETVSLTGHAAVTTAQVQPMYGPGSMYDMLEEKNKSRIQLSSGTSVSVFFEVDGWVFAEFNTVLGLTRAWIPADQVTGR